MKRLIAVIALCSVSTTALAQEPPEKVVMKLGEFLKLYEQTKDREKDPEKAPRAFAISSASYTGDVVVEDGEAVSATFRSKMKVDVLKDEGWVRVPLLPSAVALQSAKIGGVEAPVVIEGGFYTLVTDRRGTFDVDLEFAVSVFNSEGSSGFSFQMVPSGGTTVELAVPSDEDLDFKVANARLQSDRVQGNTRIVTATLPATGSLAVSWQREIPEDEKEEARVYAEVYTLVGLGDGLLTAKATINHTILFAGVEQLKVDIPEGVTLLDVQGAGIREWTTDDAGDLTVTLNYAAEGSYPLTLEMERVVGEGNLTAAAPIAIPQNVERSKGWVGVEARGNLELSGGEVKNATPIDVRSLPGGILGITSNPVLLGYKYLGTEAAIPLKVDQHADVDVLVTILDQAQATTMWTIDGRRLTSVRYQVRNNRRQFLRLSMPAGAELWSASVGGRAVQPAKAGDGRVMVPLVRSQASGGSLAAFNVEVVYIEDGGKPGDNGAGTFEAELPKPDAPTTYVGWTVYAPWDAKVGKKSKDYDGTLRKVDYLSNPIPSADVYAIQTSQGGLNNAIGGQGDAGSMGQGAVPVPVSLPVEGNPLAFERLLADDERLFVSFDYKGLK